MAANNNVTVNYEDERFGQVESDKQQAMTELEQTYGGMVDQSDSYYQAQIDASKQWANQQQQIQQAQTDFTIEKIEQEKEKAHKDYLKEQSGAYVDWRKQSNEYGAEAEKMASSGLQNTGYSESSQVSMYNTYQNRIGTARESYNNAVLNYNNAIKDAQLQNNAALAEIAYQSLQQQLELSLQGFQYKNNLILEQANKKLEVDQMYYQRYQDTLNQINYENQMAEEIRQYNQNYQLQLNQFEEEKRQFQLDYNEKVRQFNEEIERLKKKDEQEYQMEIQRLELQKKQAEEAKRQFEAEMALKEKQLAEEKRQFNEQMSYTKSKSSGGSGGGSGTYISKSNSSSGSSGRSGSSGSASISNDRGAPGSEAVSQANLAAASAKSSTPTNNMQSILNLGMGPISASKLASLMSSGKVGRTLKNGQYYYYKK